MKAHIIMMTAVAVCAMSACGGQVPLNNVDGGPTEHDDEAGKTVASDAGAKDDVRVSDDATSFVVQTNGDSGVIDPDGAPLISAPVGDQEPDGAAPSAS